MNRAIEFIDLPDFNLSEKKGVKCIVDYNEEYEESYKTNTKLIGIQDSRDFCSYQSSKIKWSIYEIRDAFLIIYPGLDGCIILNDLHTLEKQLKFRGKKALSFMFRDMLSNSLPISSIDECFVPIDPGWNNYYHFLISVVPKIKLFWDIGEEQIPVVMPKFQNYLNSNFKLSLPEHRYREILDLFDIKEKSLWRKDPGVYKVSRLLIMQSSIARLTDIVYSPYMRKMFLKYGEKIELNRSYIDKHIFLTRKAGSNRRPIDSMEDEVYEKMNEKFTIVNPGSLSFKQQVSLFKSASKVSGLHGAAFTNMLFSDGNIRSVCEYMSDTKRGYDPRPHFYHISKVIGADYFGEYIT